MTDEWLARARSFGAQAERYQRTRPGYPIELVDRLFGADPIRVADVGAGTGKWTALLIARGHSAIAIEPDDEMRAVLARVVPRASVVAGSGEKMPIGATSVDAVTYAQSWHWVDRALAIAEAARVLRPGGSLALIWNVDADSPFQRDVCEITQSGGTIGGMGSPGPASGFDPPETFLEPWTELVPRSTYLERASTWSGVATLDEAGRDRVMARINEAIDRHAMDSPASEVALAHVTVAFSYRKSAS